VKATSVFVTTSDGGYIVRGVFFGILSIMRRTISIGNRACSMVYYIRPLRQVLAAIVQDYKQYSDTCVGNGVFSTE
jgi:hypothetical protein